MTELNRRLALMALVWLVAACGGVTSTLRTKSSGSGKGPITFSVKNNSDAIVNNLYFAPTKDIRGKRVAPGSIEESEMWGADRLVSGALEPGGVQSIPLVAGTYDARAVDREGREQHIAGLKLRGGGEYVLELADGWRMPQ